MAIAELQAQRRALQEQEETKAANALARHRRLDIMDQIDKAKQKAARLQATPMAPLPLLNFTKLSKTDHIKMTQCRLDATLTRLKPVFELL